MLKGFYTDQDGILDLVLIESYDKACMKSFITWFVYSQRMPYLSVARHAYHDMVNEMGHAICSWTSSQAHVNTADVENAEASNVRLLTEQQTSDYRGINTELQGHIVDAQGLFRDPAHAIEIAGGAESHLSLSDFDILNTSFLNMFSLYLWWFIWLLLLWQYIRENVRLFK